jgi:hypothetical protein
VPRDRLKSLAHLVDAGKRGIARNHRIGGLTARRRAVLGAWGGPAWRALLDLAERGRAPSTATISTGGMAADEVAETSGPEGLIKVAKGMVDDLVDEVGALRQDMLRVARERGWVIIGGRIRRNPKLPPPLFRRSAETA